MINKKGSDSDGYYRSSDAVSFRKMDAAEEMELFARYREEGDLSARDEIIENQLLFVAGVAIKAAPSWMRADEIVSAANVALMKAVGQFDYTRGHRFGSYLRKFVRGEVIRACRDKAPVYIPGARTVPDTVAWHDCEVLPETVLDDEARQQKPPDTLCEAQDADDYRREKLRLALHRSNMTDLEVHIILEYFFEGKTYRQIAAEMDPNIGTPGLTRQRIEQIKRAACRKLKFNLKRLGVTKVI